MFCAVGSPPFSTLKNRGHYVYRTDFNPEPAHGHNHTYVSNHNHITECRWVAFPRYDFTRRGYGFSFSLTAQFVKESAADLSLFPWWQIAGAIILTSIPLLALAFGLYHLRLLFQTYAKRAYFSATASIHLGKTGRSIAIWTLLNLICGPLLSIWGTMREPYEHRMVTFSFTPQDVMSLFIAACVMVIAHILKQASDLHEENQQFV